MATPFFIFIIIAQSSLLTAYAHTFGWNSFDTIKEY